MSVSSQRSFTYFSSIYTVILNHIYIYFTAVAPEVLTQKGYGSAIDMWAVGVITYTLLCGYQPFQAEDQVELIDEITHARYDFHERYWRNISMEGMYETMKRHKCA